MIKNYTTSKHEDVILGLLLPVVPLGQEPVLLVFLATHPVNRSVFILTVCAVCPRRHTHRDLHLLHPGVCRVLLDQELETTCKTRGLVSIIHCTVYCLFSLLCPSSKIQYQIIINQPSMF